jgi:outer membrane protein assembly factor BamD (BamD/ComL family)
VTRSPGARSTYSTLVVVSLLAALCAVSGCSRKGKNDPSRASVETLYKNAHKAMVNSDYAFAIKNYEALTARFPFTDQARQSRLDLIYVYTARAKPKRPPMRPMNSSARTRRTRALTTPTT